MHTAENRGPSAGTAVLEFRVTDESCFLIRESGRHSCTLTVEARATRSDGSALELVTVTGCPTVALLSDALDWPTVIESRVLEDGAMGSLLQLVVSERSLVAAVADCGAVPTHISASNGVGRVVVAVPPSVDPNRVEEVFLARHSGATLLARTDRAAVPGVRGSWDGPSGLATLSERQRACFRVAYRQGFLDYPRRSTASACGAQVGLTPTAFRRELDSVLETVARALDRWPASNARSDANTV